MKNIRSDKRGLGHVSAEVTSVKDTFGHFIEESYRKS